jgi:L-fuconolactonase
MPLDVTGRYRYPSPNQAWLALQQEEVLDPDLPIVDAHHHLWQEPSNSYLLGDLLADLACGHNVIATVFAQCSFGYRPSGPEHLRPVGETEQVEAQRITGARQRPQSRPCAGIVGFADLLAPELLEQVLDAHLAASPAHFRGIRQSAARDRHFPDGIVVRPAPVGLLADPRLRQSVRRLGQRNLSFDAMIYHEQIPEVTALARAVSDTRIILDHFGAPLGVDYYRGRESETLAAVQRDIAELAQCPNVYVKLGGLGMIITGAEWHLQPRPPTSAQLANAWRPYFDCFTDLFGADRCLVESNFPVDKAMFSYAVLWNAFKRLAAGASSAEKSRLFMGTAQEAYRLDLR